MDVSQFAGKRFALLLTDENDESTAHFGWIALVTDDGVLLRRDGHTLGLDPQQIARIQPIETENLRQILPDSDFVLTMSVGPNPNPEPSDIPTGMKWPE